MKYRAKVIWIGEVENCDTEAEARDLLYEEFDRDTSTGEMEFDEFDKVDD